MSKTNYVLIHGQLVEVSDDVLMHWKYIKREKKNGRWVYTYKDSNLDKLSEEFPKALEAYGKSYEKALDLGLSPSQMAQDRRLNKQKAEVDKLEKKYRKAKKQYKKSAGHKVADLLNKTSSSIDKTKKWLKSLFK